MNKALSFSIIRTTPTCTFIIAHLLADVNNSIHERWMGAPLAISCRANIKRGNTHSKFVSKINWNTCRVINRSRKGNIWNKFCAFNCWNKKTSKIAKLSEPKTISIDVIHTWYNQSKNFSSKIYSQNIKVCMKKIFS